MSLSKKNRLLKDQEKMRKRDIRGLASDEEVSSSDKSIEETFEEKKDRVRRQKLNQLRQMKREDRQQALIQATTATLDLDPEEEQRQAKLEVFLNRVGRDEEYPVSTIQKLIVMKMKEYEDKNKNAFTDSKMAKLFA